MIRSRRVAAVAALAVLTLALSGCVRMGVEVELKPDDAAASGVVLAVEDQYLDQTGQSPSDAIDTLIAGREDPADKAVRTEDFEQDGYTGTRYVYAEAGIDEVGTQVGWPIEVVREGGDYVVTGTLDLTEQGLGGRGGVSADNLSVTIDVTFPGSVETANGTINGNTVHWEPPVGEPFEIRARGSAGDPPTADGGEGAAADGEAPPVVPEWMVLVLALSGLVIMLLIGIIVWQAMMRLRDRPPAAAPALPQQRVAPQDPNRPPSFPPGS